MNVGSDADANIDGAADAVEDADGAAAAEPLGKITLPTVAVAEAPIGGVVDVAEVAEAVAAPVVRFADVPVPSIVWAKPNIISPMIVSEASNTARGSSLRRSIGRPLPA